MADPKQSRGYRNCNPGNIDYNERNRWQGQVGIEARGRFAVFSEHRWGIRAIAVLLITYQDRYGCDSHPSQRAQAEMAAALEAEMAKSLGWKATPSTSVN